MKNKIKIYDKKISYFLKKSDRAKRMRIAVYHDGEVIVTIPKHLHNKEIEKYMANKSKWIESKLTFYTNLRRKNNLNFNNVNFEEYKDRAYSLIEAKLKYLQSKYKYKFNLIKIKNQKTIWGSCSKKNNLSFNFKVALLKPKIRDYVIVHEFCHLKIKSHSRKFWLLVGNILPEYFKIRNKLINYSLQLS